MYYEIIDQCISSLKLVEIWLDKAEQHAAAKKYDVSILMSSRLAPDAYDFIKNVQSSCDYAKSAVSWLSSGKWPPSHVDTEKTVDEIRARIKKTISIAERVKETAYNEAFDQKVLFTWAPMKIMNGDRYLLQMIIPNIYFHLTMAYAILRHNGVDVGKDDFLGKLDLIELDDSKMSDIKHSNRMEP